jgi:potassium-transporting ATPase KdpC subunit
MWSHIGTGLRMNILLTILAGVFYPLAITGICQIAFPHQANGSLIKQGDRVIGSELIGQSFTNPEYFHPRPSAAGAAGYDATASGGSNLGPTNAKLILGTTMVDDKNREIVDFDGIGIRIVHYCIENEIPYESSVPLDQFKDVKGNLDDVRLIKSFHDDKAPFAFTPKAPIPADAVTASGSGLDPHISPANAHVQAVRVAKARGIPVDTVKQLILQWTESPSFAILGDPRVNVLRLNLALDRQCRIAGVADKLIGKRL